MKDQLEPLAFKEILDSAEIGYMICDATGKILYTNQPYERIVGSVEPMVGHNLQEYVKLGTIKSSNALTAIRQERKISSVTKILPVDSKEPLFILVTSTPAFDEKGRLYRVVTTATDHTELSTTKRQIRALEEYIQKNGGKSPVPENQDTRLIAQSSQMQHVLDMVDRVKDVNTRVMVLGESGVGKELVVQHLRRSGIYRDRPFIAVNCSAFSDSLLESELFGYVGGSFTGANREGKMGVFEAAGNGILFLDEIGEISLALQAKLLRVLEDNAISRVGDYHRIPVHARIICATNRDLKKMIREGTFRDDLYYRLNVISLVIPPLRERTDDILPLAYYYLRNYNALFEVNCHFSKSAIDQILQYSWPGNARELKNAIERLVVTSTGSLIRGKDVEACNLQAKKQQGSQQHLEERFSFQFHDLVPLNYALEAVERELLLLAKRRLGSSRKIARELETSRATISRKLKKYGISENEEDSGLIEI